MLIDSNAYPIGYVVASIDVSYQILITSSDVTVLTSVNLIIIIRR